MDTTRKNRFLNAVRLACIMIFTFSFTQTSATAAGTDGWQSIGPDGGSIVSLVIDPVTPATIYVGTESSGVFKSSNGGQSWRAINTDLNSMDIEALAMDPTQPATLYAGTMYGGVFKSIDGGEKWTAASNGLTEYGILSLAIDPLSPSILYAGTWQDGMFKSYDGGRNWIAINTNLTDVYFISGLAIHPTDPAILYIGTGNGVYKTTDGGVNWSPVNAGLPNPYTPNIEALVMDPTSPDTLYAGTWQGIFKSTNGGMSWTEINNGLNDRWINSLAVDPLTPGTVYAGAWDGVYKSTDGGDLWNSASSGLSYSGVRVIAIDPLSPATLYAGGYDDLFKSSNAAGDWSLIHNGLTATSIHAMAVDPLATETLYIGIGDEIYKTTDDGLHWNPLHVATHFSIPIRDRIQFLVADPVTPQTVYAGIEMKGILKSTDGGVTWKEMNSGLLNYQEVHDLVIDPWIPDTLYAAARNEIYKSMDGGQYWQRVDTGLTDYAMEALAIDPLNPATIYAGSYGGELFKTIDGSASWSPAGQAVAPIQVIRVDPKLAGIVHVGTADGILRTTDGGTSWSASRLTGMRVEAIAIDPVTSATLYAGTNAGVFKSTDVGMTWNAFNTGLGQPSIHELATNPLEPMLLYAGTEGAGVAKYSSSATACQAAAGEVVINEIFPSPSNNGMEWVELYNTTDHPVSIGSCFIDDIPDAGSSPHQIPAATILPTHGFWTSDHFNYFNNDSDQVRFLKDDGITVLDSYTFASTGYDRSRYRLPDGGAWAAVTTAFPTKGQTNTLPFYPIVSSSLRSGANPTDAGSVTFTVNFSKAVTGVNITAPFADFSLTASGVSGAHISAISGSGSSYTVTVNTGDADGTIRLNVVDDDTIRDSGNKPLGGTGAGNGNFTTGESYTIDKAVSFADVSPAHPYWQDIEILYANGLTGGCSTNPLKFCPDQIMNRGQAAVFMLRANFGSSYVPPAPAHIFQDDWSKGIWAEPWAEGMKAESLSAGCQANPLKYCPWDQVPREQAVIFALRMKYGTLYTPPPATGTVFADLTNPSYYATSWAEQAYKEGIIKDCGMSAGKPKFCPKDMVSRGLAAYMIVQAKSLTMP